MHKVSVIIPTYNRSAYLPAAIESVLRQEGVDVEVLVVDDGSTDNTAELVARYAPEVRYLWQENRGCAAARNLGVRNTSSSYLAFLDSDDLFAPRKLSLQCAVLDSDSSLGFVYSDSIEFRTVDDKVNYFLLPAVARTVPATFAINHFQHLGVRPGSLLIRRQAFDATGGFDEGMRYNEDSDFIQRLAIRERAGFSSYPAILQRQHNNNKSSNRLQIYHALLGSLEKVLADSPGFRLALGEEAAERRLAAVKFNIRQLQATKGDKPPVGLFLRGINCIKRMKAHYGRKVFNLFLRRQEVLAARHIIAEMADLLVGARSG